MTRLSRGALRRYREGGLGGLAREGTDFLWSHAAWWLRRPDKRGDTFEFRGRPVPYVRHPYNRAWRNERSVELAVAYDFLADRRAERVLEFGNVLSHYGPVGHEVLDKYERAPGVLNEDIVDFRPARPYDAVVSVSTLEHVGWDERPEEPEKVLRAYENLKRLLRPGGAMLVTAAIGYNPHLDRYLREGRFDFPVGVHLKRISEANEWREVDPEETAGTRYGSPFRNANAVFVGIVPGD